MSAHTETSEPPLITGTQSFHTVSQRISEVTEARIQGTPKLWWVLMVISLLALANLGASIAYLFWEGIGIWGVQNR